MLASVGGGGGAVEGMTGVVLGKGRRRNFSFVVATDNFGVFIIVNPTTLPCDPYIWKNLADQATPCGATQLLTSIIRLDRLAMG